MSEALIKQIWPDWRVVRRIGAGSYGSVYEVCREDGGVRSVSAIKVITIPRDEAEIESLASEGLSTEESYTYLRNIVNNLVREIELMLSLKSAPNIVTIEDYKVIEDHSVPRWDILIRMELLTPLNQYIAAQPGGALSRPQVIKLGKDICTALEYCERVSVIHRDIKPGNILVNAFGDFKLADFGVARQLESCSGGLSMVGTPNYMAPEVRTSIPYDATVDQYSLGIVLYQQTNRGRLPFIDPNTPFFTPQDRDSAYVRRMSGEPLPPPCQADGRLSSIILKACSPRRENRYPTPAAMREDLLRYERGIEPGAFIDLMNRTAPLSGPYGTNHPDERKKPPVAAIAAAGVGGLVLLGLALGIGLSRTPEPGPDVILSSGGQSVVAAATESVVPTDTPAPALTDTPTPVPTDTPTPAPTDTPTPVPTGTPTPAPTDTPTPVSTDTPTPAPTDTPTPAPTDTPTPVPTGTPTPVPTDTPTPVPTDTPTPASALTPSLQKGDRGDEVLKLQRRLTELGYQVEDQADGIYGAYTADAVYAFQRAVGLPPTGTADPETAALLMSDDALPCEPLPADAHPRISSGAGGAVLGGVSAKASAALTEEVSAGRYITWSASNALQQDDSKPWAMHSETGWIELKLNGRRLVSGFAIRSGYQVDDRRYYGNYRPKDVDLYADGSYIGSVTLQDVKGTQYVVFDAPLLIQSLRLDIGSGYPSNHDPDMCISYLGLTGIDS
ncbi:MAG: protein kinase [Clostridia bacterium]|nr:protein kinase [Clostridia bacterium]